MINIKLYYSKNFDKNLAPIPAEKYKSWWEDNNATKNHARHCLPLSMANSLGYYILSPGTFMVKWDGDYHKKAEIVDIEKSSHYEVDNHAANGSFTVQPKFIPVTEKPGQFVYIKGVPNERGLPYSCMEAAIEAWWNVGNFGLVYLLNQPGEFIINKGTPIAQMFVFNGSYGNIKMQEMDGNPQGHEHWLKRRSRPDYNKDLDYLKGYNSAGQKIPTHITNWKDSDKYDI